MHGWGPAGPDDGKLRRSRGRERAERNRRDANGDRSSNPGARNAFARTVTERRAYQGADAFSDSQAYPGDANRYAFSAATSPAATGIAHRHRRIAAKGSRDSYRARDGYRNRPGAEAAPGDTRPRSPPRLRRRAGRRAG